MCQHEIKSCSRCHSPFECKVGNVSQCHCSNAKLTPEQRAYLASKYTDCLCANCLTAIKKEMHFGPDNQRSALLAFLQQNR